MALFLFAMLVAAFGLMLAGVYLIVGLPGTLIGSGLVLIGLTLLLQMGLKPNG